MNNEPSKHDVEVAANTLDEAAAALNVDAVGFRSGWGSANEGDRAALDALAKAVQWLRDRAAALREPTP